MDIGSRIRKARKDKKIGMSALARCVGTTTASISRYECGEREPSLDMLARIATALDVPLSFLLDSGVQGFDSPEKFETERKKLLSAVRDGDAEELAIIHSADGGERYVITSPRRTRLLDAFDQLNREGQEKAVERLEELVEIPRYQVVTEEGNSEQ